MDNNTSSAPASIPQLKFSPEQLQQIMAALSAAQPAGAIPASQPLTVLTKEVQESIAAAHKEILGAVGHVLGSAPVTHLRLKRIEEKLGIPFELPTETV